MSEIKQSTMRPLLTRLRDRPKDHLLLHEAADEIERLTAALAACQTHDYRQIIEESDRYRMALETIANYSGNVEPALLLKYLAEAALKSPAETAP